MILVVCSIAFVTYGISVIDGNSIKGSGKLVKESRSVTDFTGIEAGGAVKLDVTNSSSYSVEVEADDNLMSYVETKVTHGVLVIGMKDGYSYNNSTIHVHVSLPTLHSLEISGASEGTASNISTDKLSLELSGASHLNIDGKASKLTCEVSGASSLKAGDLMAENVSVECSGASSSYVYASSSLTVDASGASKVSYSGNPADVTRESSGASSIVKR